MIPRCTVEAVEYHAISTGLLTRDKSTKQGPGPGQGQGQGPSQVKRYPSFVHWLVHTVGVAVAGTTPTTPSGGIGNGGGGNGNEGVGLTTSSSSSLLSGSPLSTISPPLLCGDARGAVNGEKTRLLRSLAAAGGVWGNQVPSPPLSPLTPLFPLTHPTSLSSLFPPPPTSLPSPISSPL